jgi:hypothetical protein
MGSLKSWRSKNITPQDFDWGSVFKSFRDMGLVRQESVSQVEDSKKTIHTYKFRDDPELILEIDNENRTYLVRWELLGPPALRQTQGKVYREFSSPWDEEGLLVADVIKIIEGWNMVWAH